MPTVTPYVSLSGGQVAAERGERPVGKGSKEGVHVVVVAGAASAVVGTVPLPVGAVVTVAASTEAVGASGGDCVVPHAVAISATTHSGHFVYSSPNTSDEPIPDH